MRSPDLIVPDGLYAYLADQIDDLAGQATPRPWKRTRGAERDEDYLTGPDGEHLRRIDAKLMQLLANNLPMVLTALRVAADPVGNVSSRSTDAPDVSRNGACIDRSADPVGGGSGEGQEGRVAEASKAPKTADLVLALIRKVHVDNIGRLDMLAENVRLGGEDTGAWNVVVQHIDRLPPEGMDWDGDPDDEECANVKYGIPVGLDVDALERSVRQADAEALRERCAQAAENAFVVMSSSAREAAMEHALTLAAKAIRALPLSDPPPHPETRAGGGKHG